jgi:dTDP-4-dehydrorhamnose 3,5-epimerase
VLEPAVHGDDRGFFAETFRADLLPELGVREQWVQDNQSRSVRGVLRGLHLQVGPGQAKLVRCARGRVLDVAVDVRRGSPSYGRWSALELDDRALLQVYVPVGFAHGYCVLSEVADVVYKCSSYYDRDLERTIAWDDPDLAIDWPLAEPVLSPRDRTAPRLADVAGELPFAWVGA